jgi:hypothetical protein
VPEAGATRRATCEAASRALDYPPELRLHFVLDFSPHLGEKIRTWAADNNVELAFTPFYASWLNRIEAQFRALRSFTLAGTDHPTRHPGPADPPLHRVAQPQHRQPAPTRARQHGKRESVRFSV